MANYYFIAKNEKGDTIKGNYQAENTESVIQFLRQKSYIPIEVDVERKPILSKEISFKKSQKVKTKDLALFCRQFATTLRAGITVTESLLILKKQTSNKHLQKIIENMYEDVQKGESLSATFSKEPKVFPRILTSMVETGEISGALDEIMDNMAVYFEKEYKINQKVKSAITYPIIVSIVALLVVILLITFVIPTFVQMFDSFDAQLPLPTKILLALSSSMRSYWYLYIAAVGLLIYGIKKYAETDTGKQVFDRWFLRMPIFGDLNMKIAMARFSINLSILLNSGVDIIRAVEIVERVVGNSHLRKKIMEVKEDIRQGYGLGLSMEKSGAFPPLVYQMIDVGENSGTIDEILQKVSEFYEMEVDSAVGQLTTIIEPLIIVVLGGVIAFIMVAMLLPMFDLYGIIA
ncbi:MAG TPA: type II secretion system protein F [Eubacteriaceae bacterium]|nr:type II secretion system protein F [Eubacteriaceae bacterium]